MVVAIEMSGKVIGFVQSYRLPRRSAVNLHVGGKFEIGVLIVGHATVHHFSDISELLRVLYEVGVGFGATSLRPNLGGTVPNGDGLGIQAAIYDNG